jgi:hypothetical protein
MAGQRGWGWSGPCGTCLCSSYWGPARSFVPFVGFALILVGYSYFLAAVRQAGGKRTMAGLVAHGWVYAFAPLFPTIVMAEGAAQQRDWIRAGLTLLAGVLAMIVRAPGDPDRTIYTSAATREEAAMGSYAEAIDILEAELQQVEYTFAGPSPEGWAMPTKLVPIDSTQPPWTVFELAGT